MWLSRQMAAREDGHKTIVDGRVTTSRGSLTVQADGEYRSLAQYGPAGVAALPTVGDDALLAGIGGKKGLLGVRSDTAGLEPGEIRLRSSGGAEIWLKNTGEVVINGQVFDAVAKEDE